MKLQVIGSSLLLLLVGCGSSHHSTRPELPTPTPTPEVSGSIYFANGYSGNSRIDLPQTISSQRVLCLQVDNTGNVPLTHLHIVMKWNNGVRVTSNDLPIHKRVISISRLGASDFYINCFFNLVPVSKGQGILGADLYNNTKYLSTAWWIGEVT